MCVVESCAPSPICFSSTSHVKPDFKKEWGGCQFGPSTNSCTVLLKVLCISLINGVLWLISLRGQIWISQHHAAKLVWYRTFLTGYQQGCSSGSQDASHPLRHLPPPVLSGKICSVSRLCFRSAKPSTLILCGVTLRQPGSAEWVKSLAEVWLHATKFEAW